MGRKLLEIIKASEEVLANHDVNKVRIDLGENPANGIWLWGAGKMTHAQPFHSKFHIPGVMVSTSGMARGLAAVTGMDWVGPKSQSIQESTDLMHLTDLAIEEVKNKSLVIIYDDHAHQSSLMGDYRQKVRWIESIDRHIIGELIGRVSENCPIGLTSVHATSSSEKKILSTQTPYLISKLGDSASQDQHFCERTTLGNNQLITTPAEWMRSLLEA